jgi:hypothetical protein
MVLARRYPLLEWQPQGALIFSGPMRRLARFL